MSAAPRARSRRLRRSAVSSFPRLCCEDTGAETRVSGPRWRGLFSFASGLKLWRGLADRRVMSKYEAMGREAFERGAARVPVRDPKLMAALVGDIREAMRSWLYGWDVANLESPVEAAIRGCLMVESKPAHLVRVDDDGMAVYRNWQI